MSLRAFAVDPDGVAVELWGDERIEHMGFSPAVIAAVDVLQDAGQFTRERGQAVMAAERDGKDPVAFAHHLVTLCRIAQDTAR